MQCGNDIKILRQGEGRIQLTLQLMRLGTDLCCFLTGGAAHIGATALALKHIESKEEVWQCVVPTHREAELACELAWACAKTYHCTVQATVGIHYDQITHAEINLVLELAQSLIKEACSAGADCKS